MATTSPATVGELQDFLRFFDPSIPVYLDGAELMDMGEIFANKKAFDGGEAPVGVYLASDFDHGTEPDKEFKSWGPSDEEVIT